jgi:hypothetical protein
MGQVVNRNVLHYNGDCIEFDPDVVMGPDWLGSYYRPVSTTMTDDVTTMTLSPLMPDELSERITKLMDKGRPRAADTMRIKELFT